MANTLLPGDFRHAIVGMRTGSLDYPAKNGLNEFYLISDLISAKLISSGARTDSSLEVGAVIDRQSVRRSFRLKLSSVLSQGVLGISHIDNLLGPGMNLKIITGGR